MPNLQQRSYQKELMDDLNCQGEMLKQTLHELKVINKLLGGNHVTTGTLQKLLTKNTPYHIADMGCGGGDHGFSNGQLSQ